jgi:hypothetical protein
MEELSLNEQAIERKKICLFYRRRLHQCLHDQVDGDLSFDIYFSFGTIIICSLLIVLYM